MRLKSSNKRGFIFLTSLLVMVVILLSLKQRYTKKPSKYALTPDFEQTTTLDFIQITLNEKSFKKLKKKRDKALSVGVLETSDSDYVPATIAFNGNDYRAEIRLKGDWTDHLEGDKWSFRIKLKDDKTILGMRKFSIHHPRTRGNINEWLYHNAIKSENLIGLRYNFIEGSIHIKLDNASGYDSKLLGVYAIEETFDKRTIESNQRKESVILKFSENFWWDEVKKSIQVAEPSGARWNRFMNPQKNLLDKLQIAPFSEEKVLMDSTMNGYFKLSKNLLEDLRKGRTTIDKVFDVKKLALQNAILNLFGATHGIYSINLRFYYNPITSKLEPIAFDGNSGIKLQKYAHFLFLDQEKDSVYLKELIKALHKVSQPSYLDDLIQVNKEDLNYFDKELKRELKGRLYSIDNYKYNQNVMRNELMRLVKKYNLDANLVIEQDDSKKTELSIPEFSRWQNKSLVLNRNKAIYEITRKDNINASYLKINNLNIDFGKEYTVSIVAKKGNSGSLLGLRLQGVYPNRVDAVFDLNKGEVVGSKKQGTFENEKVSITPIGSGWFKCTLTAKVNVDQLNIILGPTDNSKGASNWEGQTATIPSIYLDSDKILIEERK
ncbi:hypothetical protein SAMN04515667_0549 [Formosa sp. Hel1_31_208]|uniref:phage head spike fiber domain-containing protein n=1 Tax=Formosa sp. Hel1_31_208 TaxID=1798225 RepID=UPI00087A61D9|nr:hypothetical protein [Formosa sp. Hel1_31_208]SDR75238.1 hypothetical protein SAMN04515667_0549 [Formosa sp. Hel1_31_208]